MSGGGDGNGGGRTVFRPASPLQSRKPSQRPASSVEDESWDTAPPPSSAGYAAPPPLSRDGTGPAGVGLAPSRLAEDDVPLPATPRAVRNLMMTEAAPVLALAAGVRAGRVRISLPQFHREAIAAITSFEQAITPHYPDEQRQRAKYAVCATIDDIAQNLPNLSLDGAEWARRSMVVHFFHESIAGDRFWQLVDDMLRYPNDNLDLIELYHACLAAGFEGRFRQMGDGKRRLHEVMARLQGALDHVRTLSSYELTPRWLGEQAPPGKPAFWNLIALAAAGALAFLVFAYIIYLVILMSTGAAPSDAIAKLYPKDPLTLSRPAQVMVQPVSGQKQALEDFLTDEIRAHQVVVVEDGATVRVRTTIGELFRSGSDQLEPDRDLLFVKIGQAIEKEQGPVLIEGHADSDRISTNFTDNAALSEARARTVATIIRSQLTDAGRVTVEGRGEGVPIASNDTPEGKAQNRRVEIIVQRRNGGE